MRLVAKYLPCRYCSTSLSEFLRSDMGNLGELSSVVVEKDVVQKWMWKLHNLVNAKLRREGLITIRRNPQLDLVINHYHIELEKSCSQLEMPGWDFLFSIIFSQAAIGVITRENRDEKRDELTKLFDLLSDLLPQNCEYVKAMKRFLIENPINDVIGKTGGRKLVKWIYNMYNEIHCEMLHRDQPSLSAVCKKFEQYRVNTCTSFATKGNITAKSGTCRTKMVVGGNNTQLFSSPYTIKKGCIRKNV